MSEQMERESDVLMITQKNNLWLKNIQRTLLMITTLGVVSGLGYIFKFIGFPDTNVVVIYLLAVLITAWLTGSFAYGFIASIAATFLFYYLFAEPFFAFAVDDPDYIVTLIIMTFTALVTSTLTSHTKRSTAAAQEKEAETKAVYNLTNRLSEANNIHDIASFSVAAISEYFSCDVDCFSFDEDGIPEQTFTGQISSQSLVKQETLSTPESKTPVEEFLTGFNTEKIDDKFVYWPINGRENILGVLRVPTEAAQKMTETQMRLLRSMIKNTALAMDRFWSVEQRIKSREEIAKERSRANLLRAISHDIRTPISGISGASEMIIGMTKPEDPCHDLARGIQKDADWLYSLVENILNLTRLQDGKLTLKKQPEVVEEVIDEAISHISKRAAEYEITASVPDELILIPMDAKLIVQAIINLLDNAIKHTEPGKDISIMVELDNSEKMVTFKVKDSGSGVDKNDLRNIFQVFYTKENGRVGAGGGTGLGLAICETIIKAHGGNIEARNRTDGSGLEVVFSLPTEDGLNDKI